MPTVKHKFVSGKADGTDVTLVKPTNWNDDHDVEISAPSVVLGRDGSGPGPWQELPILSLVVPGFVALWAGSTAPTGWILCQGQSLLKADYPKLAVVCGTQYGAGDATHFVVPDMRGRVVAGVDGGVGRLTTVSINTPNVPGGVGGGERNQAYTPMTVSGNLYGNTGGEALSAHTWGATSTENGGLGTVGGGPAIGTHNHSVDIWGQTSGTQSVAVGGSLAGAAWSQLFVIVQPTIMMNYVIKLD